MFGYLRSGSELFVRSSHSAFAIDIRRDWRQMTDHQVWLSGAPLSAYLKRGRRGAVAYLSISEPDGFVKAVRADIQR